MSTTLAPEVKPVTNEQMIEEFMDFLKDLEETPCEYNHVAWYARGGPQCSGGVTHVVRDCRISILVCTPAANHVIARANNDGIKCKHCNRHPRECWKIQLV